MQTGNLSIINYITVYSGWRSWKNNFGEASKYKDSSVTEI